MIRKCGLVGFIARPLQGRPLFMYRMTLVGLGGNKEVKLSLCGSEAAGSAPER